MSAKVEPVAVILPTKMAIMAASMARETKNFFKEASRVEFWDIINGAMHLVKVMGLFVAGSGDKGHEERVGTERSGDVFWVELSSDKKGMLWKFDGFDQLTVWRQSADG